jgi:hypothetical protein
MRTRDACLTISLPSRRSRSERVEPWKPTPTELAALTSEYVSDEAKATFRVVAERGRLLIRRRPDTVILLTPAYKEAFRSSLGVIRFLLDNTDRVNELSVSGSRVWDLRFHKTQ